MNSVIGALFIYAVVLVMTRLSGRRTLAQVTVFDLVLVLLIAETGQQAMVGDDPSLTNSVVLMATLILTDVLLSLAKKRSPRLHRLIDGVPTVLVRNGRPDAEALRMARVSEEDILEAARSHHGLRRMDEVDFAVLESSGTISIIPVRSSQSG